MDSVMNWTKYSWENKESHPPKPGRYLIYRKGCDKMHFEQWNGRGWASSNNDCTDWCDPSKPDYKKKIQQDIDDIWKDVDKFEKRLEKREEELEGLIIEYRDKTCYSKEEVETLLFKLHKTKNVTHNFNIYDWTKENLK